jgi:hypothetical protein
VEVRVAARAATGVVRPFTAERVDSTVAPELFRVIPERFTAAPERFTTTPERFTTTHASTDEDSSV